MPSASRRKLLASHVPKWGKKDVRGRVVGEFLADGQDSRGGREWVREEAYMGRTGGEGGLGPPLRPLPSLSYERKSEGGYPPPCHPWCPDSFPYKPGEESRGKVGNLRMGRTHQEVEHPLWHAFRPKSHEETPAQTFRCVNKKAEWELGPRPGRHSRGCG